MTNKTIKRIFALIVVLTISFALVGCTNVKYDTTMQEGNLDKATSLNVRDDGSFKVLQLNDLHLTSGGTYKLDNETLRWVEQAVDTVKPDLVELTGDSVGSGVKGRNAGLLALANIFEKRQVYWAYTFGNHDGEHSVDDNGKDLWIGKVGKPTDLSKAVSKVADTFDTEKYDIFYGDNTKGNLELFQLLKGYKYSLINRSAEEQIAENEAYMGVGNYTIELKDNNGNVKFVLFHMDTHGKFYINEKGNTDTNKYIDGGYVGLTDMQVDWYDSKVASYAEQGIKSAIFMHVPNYGYRLVYESKTGLNKYGVPQFTEKSNIGHWITKSSSNLLPDSYLGYTPEKYASVGFLKEEGIYAPRWDDGLMSVIAQHKSTLLISVGHDHNNAFANVVDMDSHNIMLAYGRTSGVNAWARDVEVGASVYTFNTNNSTLNEIIDINVVFPDFKYTPKGNR